MVFQLITCTDLLDLDHQLQLYSTIEALFFGITGILFFAILVLFVIIFIFIFYNLQICCFKQSRHSRNFSQSVHSKNSESHTRQYPEGLHKSTDPEYFEIEPQPQLDYTRQNLQQCQCPGACNCDSINSKDQFPIYEDINV